MCGIAGYFSRPGDTKDVMQAHVSAMSQAILHRGPDSHGKWVDAQAAIAMGHQRLAIVDVSEAGAQPMVSQSGRFVIAFNGEIYNHLDLRAQLETAGLAPQWRGHSDTEALLAGIDVWGLDQTLSKLIGMFAIALWDRKDRSLSLARDRMGEKPLYYGWQGQGDARCFLWGSEIKSLAQHPSFERQIERNVLPEFLRHGHVGENRSIYRNIAKVRPGEIIELSLEAPEPSARVYWSGADLSAQRSVREFADPQEAVEALDTLLLDAVGQQMMADVPLGAFLSGGIDSSVVVAMMQRVSQRPVHTFSIGFHEERYNEAEHARAVAAHLGTHHTDLYVDQDTLLSVLPLLPAMYDEPHADSSQIPTYLVAKLARKHVTVALSGDGGDELFAGYGRYAHGAKLRRLTGWLPQPVRQSLAFGVRAIPRNFLSSALEHLRATPQGKEPNGQRLHRLADYLRSRSLDDLHKKLVSRWRFPEAAVLGAESPATLLDDCAPPRGSLSDIERMMQLDMLTYLPDDILAKVDRATMAVSLESRAPLLDHRIVEFALSLAPELKHRGGGFPNGCCAKCFTVMCPQN